MEVDKGWKLAELDAKASLRLGAPTLPLNIAVQVPATDPQIRSEITGNLM